MQKRRGRPPATLGRIDNLKEGESRILIACEGECTEPEYFDGLRRELRFFGLDIRGEECGSDPLSVVLYGIDQFKEDGGFDELFCLVDRDSHQTFAAALEKVATEIAGGLPIRLVPSYPCFEVWGLMHFEPFRKPLVAAGGRSAGEALAKWLVENLRTVLAIIGKGKQTSGLNFVGVYHKRLPIRALRWAWLRPTMRKTHRQKCTSSSRIYLNYLDRTCGRPSSPLPCSPRQSGTLGITFKRRDRLACPTPASPYN
ncbi:hypothetical protein GRI34_05620 [Erythrobacter aquimaris]|uniref:RloB domain-containing protein n=1 Tax=Qipengyuania aquimaris TaxID=255984 RepID=A0A6I4TL34_9SPHN|nr:RloB family protein [Qipengyuania aquimaris]MXO95900.1 hypothetical protein [Qipengyuania aquimaris]